MHFVLVIIIILVIVGFQISIFRNTIAKLSAFKSIFPDSKEAYKIEEISFCAEKSGESGEGIFESVQVSQIEVKSENPTMREILQALNMYLQKNRGAASDFYLIKDVVERYCDAEEEEISVQQPIPLYLGLMGTMVGIIIGIGFIAFSGGLAGGRLMDNITALMTCVAIAMGASFVGICCTTLISWKYKSAKTKIEADKNRFYSWLQTELLPTLSGNTVNALYLLQQNLMTFNTTFQSNIRGLSEALSKVEDSSKEQIELISLIKDIDIKRVAQANVSVLKELKDCTGELTTFNKYLHSVSDYLVAVNELNGNINEHLNRTAAIERMGTFFEQEIKQVSEREQYINAVVAKVDDTLRKTFENLSESTKTGIIELKNSSVTEFDALVKHISGQKEEFSRMLQEQRNEFSAQSEETIAVMKEIRNLADIKSVMSQLLDATMNQTAMLERMANNAKHSSGPVGTVANEDPNRGEIVVNPKIEIPKKYTYMAIAVTGMVFLSFGLFVYNSFLGNKSHGLEHSEAIVTSEYQSNDVLENVTPEPQIDSLTQDNL